MGAAIWNEIPKPNLFEDQSSQWNQFDREWRKYENLTASTGYPFPDALKLEILKSRVGPISKAFLMQKEEENPSLPFSAYYAALAEKYQGDATDQARLAWRRIQLKIDPSGILTLGAFRKFSADFLIHRNRVSNWTGSEEYGLIFDQLPLSWKQKVLE